MKNFALPVLALAFCCAAASPQAGDSNPLATARVFAFDQMTAVTSPNGAVGRKVFSGTLATGEAVAVHETMQPAGMPPNPAHRIEHSEIIVVQEGTLESVINFRVGSVASENSAGRSRTRRLWWVHRRG